MTSTHYFEGQLLLAMPNMGDPRFERSVIYICSHDESGAMGLVVNREFESLDFSQLLEQLDISAPHNLPDTLVHSGGPVEPGRGFVLHSADFVQDSTLIVSETLALTATVDILSAIAERRGPRNHLIALGYAGWGPGQLENEIQQNAWMIADGDDEVIFHTHVEQKWPRGMAMLGVDASMLSADVGHA